MRKIIKKMFRRIYNKIYCNQIGNLNNSIYNKLFSEPVKIKDCRIQFDRIEENFLQFLKI